MRVLGSLQALRVSWKEEFNQNHFGGRAEFLDRPGILVVRFCGVQTGPGATALTRIPLSSKFLASDLVNALIAPFVAE